jgi:hypothetical protein
MPFGYFNLLSAARKKVYLRSDAIESLALPPGPSLQDVLTRIQEHLSAEQRVALERASQQLLDELTRRFNVPPVRVRIRNVRPSGNWGELHGLYEPAEQSPAVISTWMRTVARKQMVAYKTFVRTLLHEFCHHIDYELIKLPETFHTGGFYKREAALFRAIHEGASPWEK